MATNIIGLGDRINVTAPTGGVTAGDVHVFDSTTNGYIGVYLNDAAAGEEVPVLVKGRVRLPKETATGDTLTVGQRCSYIAATGLISNDAPATGKHRAGRAAEAATAAATHVDVLLNDD